MASSGLYKPRLFLTILLDPFCRLFSNHLPRLASSTERLQIPAVSGSQTYWPRTPPGVIFPPPPMGGTSALLLPLGGATEWGFFGGRYLRASPPTRRCYRLLLSGRRFFLAFPPPPPVSGRSPPPPPCDGGGAAVCETRASSALRLTPPPNGLGLSSPDMSNPGSRRNGPVKLRLTGKRDPRCLPLGPAPPHTASRAALLLRSPHTPGPAASPSPHRPCAARASSQAAAPLSDRGLRFQSDREAVRTLIGVTPKHTVQSDWGSPRTHLSQSDWGVPFGVYNLIWGAPLEFTI